MFSTSGASRVDRLGRQQHRPAGELGDRGEVDVGQGAGAEQVPEAQLPGLRLELLDDRGHVPLGGGALTLGAPGGVGGFRGQDPVVQEGGRPGDVVAGEGTGCEVHGIDPNPMAGTVRNPDPRCLSPWGGPAAAPTARGPAYRARGARSQTPPGPCGGARSSGHRLAPQEADPCPTRATGPRRRAPDPGRRTSPSPVARCSATPTCTACSVVTSCSSTSCRSSAPSPRSPSSRCARSASPSSSCSRPCTS